MRSTGFLFGFFFVKQKVINIFHFRACSNFQLVPVFENNFQLLFRIQVCSKPERGSNVFHFQVRSSFILVSISFETVKAQFKQVQKM